MNILVNKPTRNLIVSMIVLVGIAIVFSKIYYSRLNNAVDYRITNAREMYKSYNKLASEGKTEEILSLLDSIESIYRNIPHYKNAFETGVLYNNRTAIYLSEAISRDSMKTPSTLFHISVDSLIGLAKKNVETSIQIYEKWLQKYDGKSKEEMRAMIKDTFQIGLSNRQDHTNYLKQRVKDMLEAQEGTKRRLSVSYTNLGVIYRLEEKYEDAVLSYQKAIELWDRNLTAENNLNILLDRPLKKRNFIQQLFPPEK